MTADHRALIEEARGVHQQTIAGCLCNGEYLHPSCFACRGHWPCLPARLAEALAGVDAELHYTKGWALSAGGSMDYWSGVAASLREELAAAERRVAESTNKLAQARERIAELERCYARLVNLTGEGVLP